MFVKSDLVSVYTLPLQSGETNKKIINLYTEVYLCMQKWIGLRPCYILFALVGLFGFNQTISTFGYTHVMTLW